MPDHPINRILQIWQEEYNSRMPSTVEPDWKNIQSRLRKKKKIPIFEYIGTLSWQYAPVTTAFLLVSFYGLWNLNHLFEVELTELSLTSAQYLFWLESLV